MNPASSRRRNRLKVAREMAWRTAERTLLAQLRGKANSINGLPGMETSENRIEGKSCRAEGQLIERRGIMGERGGCQNSLNHYTDRPSVQ